MKGFPETKENISHQRYPQEFQQTSSQVQSLVTNYHLAFLLESSFPLGEENEIQLSCKVENSAIWKSNELRAFVHQPF